MAKSFSEKVSRVHKVKKHLPPIDLRKAKVLCETFQEDFIEVC